MPDQSFEPGDGSPGSARSLSWSALLRLLREAGGVTQAGWAARLGISRRTVQRWETGEVLPDETAEAAIISECRSRSLLRRYDHGPLQGVDVTAEWLRDVLATARLGAVSTATAPAATDHPVVRTTGTDLPVPLTSLVGRDEELAAVRRLLAESRLVTLTGAGGSGKTRLALAVVDGQASTAGSDAPVSADGVVFVPLAAVTGPDAVMAEIARALAVEEIAGRSLLEGIAGALRGRAALLVLDNFEHVAPAAVDLVTLLRYCPRLRLLVTSQVPLRVAGEQVFGVAPLAAPEPARLSPAAISATEVEALLSYASVQLFVQRAAAVRPGFALTRDNAHAVAEVCARLDGLPLAIELAAARCTLLPPDALAARLEHRLRLLSSGPRDLPARQQTLRATLTWSHDLLGVAQRELLRRLAVFAGGFSLDLLESVFGVDALDLLSDLVDHSFVNLSTRSGPEPRYVLPAIVREFALEQLVQAGELDLYSAGHAKFLVALAERAEPHLMSAARSAWLERLTEEGSNIRAALRWCVAQGQRSDGAAVGLSVRLVGALWVWFRYDSPAEGRRWADAVIVLPGAGAMTGYARALFVAGQLALSQGDIGAAIPRLRESVTRFRTEGDTRNLALALSYLALALGGDDPDRRSSGEESLTVARADGDRRGEAWALYVLSVIAGESARTDEARMLAEQSVALYRGFGDTWLLALPLANLGRLAVQTGDLAGGLSIMEESLSLYREVGDRLFVAQMLSEAGQVRVRLGDLDGAEANLIDSIAHFRALGLRRGVTAALAVLADLCRRRGRAGAADRLETVAAAWSVPNDSVIDSALALVSTGG